MSDRDWEPLTDRQRYEIAEQEARLFKQERDALKAFKEYVHERLDKAGAPAQVDDEHLAAGCRIGGRLDWLEKELAKEREEHRWTMAGADIEAREALRWPETLLAERNALRLALVSAAECKSEHPPECRCYGKQAAEALR